MEEEEREREGEESLREEGRIDTQTNKQRQFGRGREDGGVERVIT